MKSIYNNVSLMQLKQQKIVGQNRHQFIYGFNNNERTNFLEKLAYSYPIIEHSYSPMAIYMRDYALPNVGKTTENIDKVKLSLVSREFLNLSIIYNIFKRMAYNENINFNSILSNSSFFGSLFPNTPVNEISKEIEKLMSIYVAAYQELFKYSRYNIPELNKETPFTNAVQFASEVKEALGNKAYFALIFDHKEEMPEISTMAINSLISSRINKDISVKVVTEAGKWNSMYDLSGNAIKNIHDYGEVELDNNKKIYMKKYIKNRKI